MHFILPSFCIYLTIIILGDIYAGISAHGTSIRDLHGIIWNTGDVSGSPPILFNSIRLSSVFRHPTGHIQAARVWSATDTHRKRTCSGRGRGRGLQRRLDGWMRLCPLLLLSRGSLKFGKQWWRLLFIVQKGITRHISYSFPLTRWEGLTLLTVNYSQPTSPLRRCGLFISDLASLSELLLLCLVSWTTARKERKSWSVTEFCLPLIESNTAHAMTLTGRLWLEFWAGHLHLKPNINTSCQSKLIHCCNCAHKLVLCSTFWSN